MSLSPLNVASLAVVSYVALHYLQSKQHGGTAPGPPGLPIIGNALDMPTKDEWLTYCEWGKKYGPICSVTVLRKHLVIINSADIMDELNQNGAIYSDRPRLEMGGELLGYSETLLLIPYGDRFRTYRKHFARMIGGTANVEKVQGILMEKERRFLRQMLSSPDNLLQNLRKLTGGIILQLTYGIDVREEGNDPFVDLIEEANSNFNAATVPGAFPVEFFPILRSLPEWLPGMGFMETARRWSKNAVAMVEVPFNYTKDQMAEGNAPASFVSTELGEEEHMTPEQIRDLKFTACSMYGGGADTTVSAEYAFFLAMVLNPDIQKKAQAELDAVIGSDRLPTLADRQNLPYINAVVLEVLRWNSVTPTGVPHRAMEDSTIRGYSVPKGSIIVVNLWNILHNAEIYPEPFEFKPERHIPVDGKPAQRDPRTICFGFGRRVCPGLFLADASLFLTIACSLLLFDISKKVENGVEITPIHEQTSGTISYPKPFKCTITSRSTKIVTLICDE